MAIFNHCGIIKYGIAGNLGEVFNLVIWVKIAKLKLTACAPMTLSVQIAKFKFHQYQLRAILPNLMLAKLTHYTVFYNKEATRCLRSW